MILGWFSSQAIRSNRARRRAPRAGLSAATLGGPDAADFTIVSNGCRAPLGAATSCQFAVAFAPHAPLGAKLATLTVFASPGGMAVSQLRGQALCACDLTIAPGAFDFGSVAVGVTSPASTFEVHSLFDTPIGPFQVGLSSQEFVITADTCRAAVLPPDGRCTVAVAFRPNSSGTASGLLAVSGSTDATTVFAHLSGSAP